MIDFFRGKRDYYKVEHFEGIYFATDTNEILHNGQSYSGILEEGKSVEDITLENGVLTVIYTDATAKTIEIESNKYQDKFEDGSDEKPHLIWSSDNWKPGKIQIKDVVSTENSEAGNVLTITQAGDVVWSSAITVTDKGNNIDTEELPIAEYYEISTGNKSIDVYSKQGVDELLEWHVI